MIRYQHFIPFVLPFLGWWFLGLVIRRVIRIRRFLIRGRSFGRRCYRR